MLSRLVLVALVVEIALYVAIGVALGATGGTAVAGAFAALLVVRLFLVAATMTVGAIAGSPRPPGLRLGFLRSVALVLGEWRALLANNLFYLPFERIALAPDPAPVPTERVPVLLVHGYFSNRGYFRPLARRLAALGVAPIFVRDYSGSFATLERFAGELHDAIEAIVHGTGQPRVAMVCHSMGGLAARAYLAAHGAGRVARVITLASPHAGTVLATLGLGANAAQMRRASAFLEGLAARERESPPGCPFTSIYSVHDNLVAPQETSRLPFAKNVAVAGYGHISLLFSRRAFELVRDELGEAGVEIPAPG